MLVIGSAVWGISRFFLTTPWLWDRLFQTLISLLCLLPFYAIGLTLTGSKLFAIHVLLQQGKRNSAIPVAVIAEEK